MICNNCPDNCIEPRSTLCLSYEGDDIGDVKCGDSLNSVLSKLVAGGTAPPTTAVETVVTSPIQTYTKTGISSCAKAVKSPKITYEVKSSSVGYTLEWNTKVDEKILSRRIITPIGTFSGEVGSAPIPPTQFPFSVEFILRFSTSCGDIQLSKRVNILKIGTYSTVLDIIDLNNIAVEMTADEALQGAYDQIALLQQQLDNVTSSDFDRVLLSLESRVTEIEAADPLASVTYTDQNVDITSSISAALTTLAELIRQNETDITALRQDLAVTNTRIDNIPSVVV